MLHVEGLSTHMLAPPSMHSLSRSHSLSRFAEALSAIQQTESVAYPVPGGLLDLTRTYSGCPPSC